MDRQDAQNKKIDIQMVERFQEYVISYSKQKYFQEYSIITLIEDMIYGIGIAIDERTYRFADGYAAWKKDLFNILSFPTTSQQKTGR